MWSVAIEIDKLLRAWQIIGALTNYLLIWPFLLYLWSFVMAFFIGLFYSFFLPFMAFFFGLFYVFFMASFALFMASFGMKTIENSVPLDTLNNCAKQLYTCRNIWSFVWKHLYENMCMKTFVWKLFGHINNENIDIKTLKHWYENIYMKTLDNWYIDTLKTFKHGGL